MSDSSKTEDQQAAQAEATESNDDLALQKAYICAQASIDKKAENLKILDLKDVSGFTDFFVICSATSDRQVQAIADSVEARMKADGYRALNTEGRTEGRWALLDFGEVVVHIFLDALRDYYNLEKLWSDCPQVPVPQEFYMPATDRLN